MDEKEVLRRGYAKTREEWWFLLRHRWPKIRSIIGMYLPGELTNATHAKEKGEADTLYLILQRTWAAAPDRPSIHTIPGWGTLCDLCSDYPTEDDDG